MNKAELIDVLTQNWARIVARQLPPSRMSSTPLCVQCTRVTASPLPVRCIEQRRRAARVARNPRTGETVKVKPTSVPAFRPVPNSRRLCLARSVSRRKDLP